MRVAIRGERERRKTKGSEVAFKSVIKALTSLIFKFEFSFFFTILLVDGSTIKLKKKRKREREKSNEKRKKKVKTKHECFVSCFARSREQVNLMRRRVESGEGEREDGVRSEGCSLDHHLNSHSLTHSLIV